MAVIGPGGGEVVGDSPERRVEILCDDEAVHATWTRYGPRRDGADLHVHRRHTDLFYVLDGELTLRLGVNDELVGVPAGCLVHVPPMVVHGFRNGGDTELRYLNFHAPGERGSPTPCGRGATAGRSPITRSRRPWKGPARSRTP